MSTAVTKEQIKGIAESLRGKLLQVASVNSTIPYNSLNAFGHAVLNAEAQGMQLFVKQVWAGAEVIAVSSVNELISLVKNPAVDAIRFEAKPAPAESLSEYMYQFGALD